jgi:hypothetical protein
VTAQSQSPFRFILRSRTIVGRGYSGQTRSGETSLAQRVIRRPSTGFQPSCDRARCGAERERRQHHPGGRAPTSWQSATLRTEGRMVNSRKTGARNLDPPGIGSS